MDRTYIKDKIVKSAIRRRIKKRGEAIVEGHPRIVISAISALMLLLLIIGFRSGLLFTIIGLYLVIDGIGSIIVYIKQSWIEHVPRLARALAGALVLAVQWHFIILA